MQDTETMKHIGLFFGSFNPIHIGHTTLAQSILEQAGLDEIIFVVSPQNPLKDKVTLLPEHIRFRMTQIALQSHEAMTASDIEFALPKPSYTVNTLRALSKIYSNDRLSLIIGTDNLRIFDRWKEHDYILSNYKIIVYPRQGDDISALRQQYPQVRIVEAPLLSISSTEIRNMLSNNSITDNPARQWLNENVWNYIIDNNLYNTKSSKNE